jgi:LuxR family maltose regulon positive regulatory protein
VELPPLPVLAGNLINELEAIEQPFILVLDDYHLIKEHTIHELLGELLRHPPRFMHLVLICRHDPPLPFSTLRARGLVNELRAINLRFSRRETGDFLQKILGQPVDDNTAAILHEKTEGWPVSLRLSGLSLRHHPDKEKMVREFEGNSGFVFEYLISDVFSVLPPAIQTFLTKTSILDRMCGPLCDKITGLDEPECNGQAYLEWLQKNNLFVIPLDDRRQWFRYHHLFKDFIHKELEHKFSPEEINALHKQAGEWLGEHGETDTSIEHFIKANDIESAIQFLKDKRQGLLNQAQWQTLEKLIKLFPAGILEKDPSLLLTKTWVMIYQGKAFEAFELLPTIKSLLGKKTGDDSYHKNLYGELQVINAWKSYNIHYDFDLTSQQSNSALKNLHRDNLYPQGIAWIFRAAALQAMGKYNKALSGIYERLEETSDNVLNSSLLLILNYIYWLEADLSNLKGSAEHLERIGLKQGHLETITNSHFFSGIAYYSQNELDRAVEILEHAFENRFYTIGIHHINISCALAFVYQETGRAEQALDIMNAISEFAMNKGNPYFILLRKAAEADVNWRQGNEAQAVHWAEKIEDMPLVPFSNFFSPQLPLLKILIYHRSGESRKRAAALLDELEAFLKRGHNRRFLIDIYALKAMLEYDLGNSGQAFTTLRESLQIAEPGGFIRPFLDLGPKMATLLNDFAKQSAAVGYAGKLLTAFRDDKLRRAPAVSESHSLPKSKSDTFSPEELLTNRELDILTLLAQRMSNKEIAEKLFISPETVKRHTINIFQKLNVHSRREAVAKAESLGIIFGS